MEILRTIHVLFKNSMSIFDNQCILSNFICCLCWCKSRGTSRYPRPCWRPSSRFCTQYCRTSWQSRRIRGWSGTEAGKTRRFSHLRKSPNRQGTHLAVGHVSAGERLDDVGGGGHRHFLLVGAVEDEGRADHCHEDGGEQRESENKPHRLGFMRNRYFFRSFVRGQLLI